MPSKTESSKSSKPVASSKPKESKEAYFIRIAQPRVKNVQKSLRILGNCSNRNNYAYSQEQVSEMFLSISEAMESVITKFTPSKTEQESFEFKK